MKTVPITMFAKIDDDTVHCDPTCELRSFHGNGEDWWEHYCSIFDLYLEYDKHAKKCWRCENCIAHERAQEEESND